KPVRREGGGRPLYGAASGRGRGAPPPRPLLPARAVNRRGPVLRRAPGDRRPPLDRPVRSLRDAPAPARLAARGARVDYEPRAASPRFGGSKLRMARGN